MLQFDHFVYLTFDCYGTLIDWETGILDALRPVVQRCGSTASNEQLLRLYVQSEAAQEAGPYKPYRAVLRDVLADIAGALGFAATDAEQDAFAAAVGQWPPFLDTVATLQALQTRYKLVILSNVDDDLFAETNRLLGVTFADIITVQQVGSYKPAQQNFHTALARIGAPVSQVLHVAQSLYHDHAPAKALGFSTVWVNRPSRLAGTGLAPDVAAQPDLSVPDLRSLAVMMGLSQG
jgi:2-haloacid dehalogenase